MNESLIREFESAWQRGERPDIAHFLENGSTRDGLLQELVRIDWEYRLKAGEAPSVDSYRDRFPELFFNHPGLVERLVKYQKSTEEWRSAIDSDGALDPNEPTVLDEPHPVAVSQVSPLPQRIGEYRIERLLGKGGFGLVYLGVDEQLCRKVAIKAPHAEVIARASNADIYLDEARTVANLDHPNIVPVYHVGSTSEFPIFVVSKFVDGSNLARRMKQTRLSPVQSAELVAKIADALHHAHKQGLVHRDIKPGNILIDNQGEVFVVDFGLALRDEKIGQGSGYCGTPAYMSPEQARGEGHRVEGRSDIFSLGVVLYELLAGRRPFKAEDAASLLKQIAQEDPRPLRQYDETIPKELERICFKALAKRANGRYTTAFDFADELRQFVKEFSQGESVVSIAPAPAQTTKETTRAIETPAITPLTPISPFSETAPPRIVPKGLRSFDAHDAEFFLELLPGPRDRNGLPDSIRFWKTRIEDHDPENSFLVGLIFGPSGCGKSSLVKAGLLPRLGPHVKVIYMEATQDDTEVKLAARLQSLFPALRHLINQRVTAASDSNRTDRPQERISVGQMISHLRREESLLKNGKILIVIDQFEQWLLTRRSGGNHDDLVTAMRQANGRDIQFLVMIRDDFMLAAARLFQDLEVPLIEGHNLRLVDLFDQQHSRRVLQLYGHAYNRLPEKPSQFTRDQNSFLDRAIKELSVDEKVISVRLSLFADMMKAHDWTAGAIERLGGAEGVGVVFLEETFSSRSVSPEHRAFEKPIHAILSALLPESGTDIKGRMRSWDDLLKTSGLSQQPHHFQRVIKILDSELRIITPTESVVEQTSLVTESSAGAPAPSEPQESLDGNHRFFQLTHDYLVAPLRLWLNQKDRQTFRGRARLALQEQAARWRAFGCKRADLPSFFNLTKMLLGTSATEVDANSSRMMRAACLHHWKKYLTGTLCLVWPILVVALGITILSLSYMIRHVWANSEFVGIAVAQVAGLLAISSVVAVVSGLVFFNRVTIYTLWRTWQKPLGIGLRAFLVMMLILLMVPAVTITVLVQTSALRASIAFADQNIARQYEATEPQTAIRYLDQAIENYPTPEMYLCRARLSLANREFTPVIDDCTHAIVSPAKPSNVGDFRGVARSRWMQFMGFAPDLSEACFIRAEAYRQTGQAELATKDLLRVIDQRTGFNQAIIGEALVALWRVNAVEFWKLPSKEPIAKAIGRVALRDGDPHVRRDAVTILGQLGYWAIDESNVLQRCLNDRNQEVQIAAADATALVKWQPEPAIKVLRDGITSNDEHIRKLAHLAAQRLGREALPLLADYIKEIRRDQNSPTTSYLPELSVTLGSPAVPELMAALSDVKPGEWQPMGASFSALNALGAEADIAVPKMEKLLETNRWVFENQTWQICQLFQSSGTLGATLRLLESPSENVRLTALQFLGYQALNQLRNSSRDLLTAMPKLKSLLGSGNPKERLAAALALFRMGGDKRLLLPVFIEGMKHDDVNTRTQVATILANYRQNGQPAVPILTVALNDPSPDVCIAAANALWAIEKQSAKILTRLGELAENEKTPDYKRGELAVLLWKLRDSTTPAKSLTVLANLCNQMPPGSAYLFYGLEGREKLSFVSQMFKHISNPQSKSQIMDMLSGVEWSDLSESKEIIGVLSSALTDGELEVRLSAASRLLDHCFRVPESIKVAHQALTSKTVDLRRNAAGCLNRFRRHGLPQEIISTLDVAIDDQDLVGEAIAASALDSIFSRHLREVFLQWLSDEKTSSQVNQIWTWNGYEFHDFNSANLPLVISRLSSFNRQRNQIGEAPVDLLTEIVKTCDSTAVPFLIHYLKHPDHQIRRMTIKVLGEMEEYAASAIEDLRRFQDDEDPAVRLEASDALWRIAKDPKIALPTALDLLQSDISNGVKLKSLQLLGKIGQPAKVGVPILARLIESAEPVLQINMAQLLYEFESEKELVAKTLLTLTPFLRVENDAIRADLLRELKFVGPFGEVVVPELLELLKASNEDFYLPIIEAVVAIVRDPERRIPILEEGLRSANKSCRAQASSELEKLGPKAAAALPILRERMQSGELSERLAISRAIFKISGDVDAIHSILSEALTTGAAHERSAAVSILEEAGSAAKEALPVLRDCLQAESLQRRIEVVPAIAKITGQVDDVAPILHQGLKSSDFNELSASINACGKIGKHSQDFVSQLLQHLSSSDAIIRENVASTLSEIGADAPIVRDRLREHLTDPDLEVRISAAAALAKIERRTDEALPMIVRTMRNGNASVRFRGCAALSELGKLAPEAKTTLENCVNDPSLKVRKTARDFLKQNQDQQ